jgi:hypothetical protein
MQLDTRCLWGMSRVVNYSNNVVFPVQKILWTPQMVVRNSRPYIHDLEVRNHSKDYCTVQGGETSQMRHGPHNFDTEPTKIHYT